MMNGTIMFSLKMQDLMSSGLIKLSSTSNSVFNNISNNTRQLTERNKVLGMSFNELQTKIKQVENTISNSNIPHQIALARRELNALQNQSNRHTGNVNNTNSSGTIAGGVILGNIATMGLSMVGNGISTMIEKSMNKETSIAGLSTFLGKSEAKDTYKNIQKDAERTPFDTASLLQVNQSLISAGLNAKTARNDTMNLANAIVAVGGSNDTLTRMAANMQQIKTNGKATALDIRQFGTAGVNIYEMLHRSTGKSIEDIKKMDVSYLELAKTLEMAGAKGGIYENALKNAMNTKQGNWSNFQEGLTNRLIDIGDAFTPITNNLINLGTQFLILGDHVINFTNWVTSSTTSANVFVTVLSGLTAGYVTYLGIMGGVALWTGIVTKAQLLWNFALSANPIGAIVVGIGALVTGVVVAYNKFEKFRAIVDGVWGVLKEVGSLIKSILMGDLSGISKSLEYIFTGKSFNNAHNTSINNSAIERHNKIREKALQAKQDKKDSENKKHALEISTKLSHENNDAGKKAGETVASTAPKVVNIHVGKFFDNIQFTTINGNESAQELEKIVMECFARIVFNGSKMV